MCLGIPGEVLSIEQNAAGIAMGKVRFGGVVREVCLAYVPDVRVGDYVIVHAGFALSVLNEEEANEVFEMLEQISALAGTDSEGNG
ncbi:MAG: HypC/HybG/HupF family hydrogenase formation chaperone [Anaerolineae bacterium]|nr:HypC/HybG/HupF family hydrogenase formation chaperone [Anaerolineae bacterium]MDW8070640.1 HypC/HybG/HupF family hydrogenase formation chaperone [Anaerolineae bacterium]